MISPVSLVIPMQVGTYSSEIRDGGDGGPLFAVTLQTEPGGSAKVSRF